MKKTTTKDIIDALSMAPHPEGGYFKETYRSDETIDANSLPSRFGGGRNLGTAIFFLLTSRDVSFFHRIKADEIWHFYLGSPLLLHILQKDGRYRAITLGTAFNRGETPQATVFQGDWFGATVINKNDFALVGCTTAPGFDFADFEIADRQQLLRDYPRQIDIIKTLTPSP
jgi:uncharacterized protein